MLSHNDIHYVTGFLHAITHDSVERVVLGDRVMDEASEARRDVDIVFVAGDVGLAGVEVKDEHGALDVIAVEALSAKLNDMPSLRTRAIVSTSGYTAPARRKARTHGVTCLELVRGPLPTISSVDLSQLREIYVRDPVWSEGPHLKYLLTRELNAAQVEELRAVWEGIARERPESFGLRIVNDQAVAAAQENTSGHADHVSCPVEYTFGLRHPVVVPLSNGDATVSGVAISGAIHWEPQIIPVTESRYLVDENGDPFAGTLLIEALEGLLAVGVTRSTGALSLYHIPNTVRARRPHNFQIGRARA